MKRKEGKRKAEKKREEKEVVNGGREEVFKAIRNHLSEGGSFFFFGIPSIFDFFSHVGR